MRFASGLLGASSATRGRFAGRSAAVGAAAEAATPPASSIDAAAASDVDATLRVAGFAASRVPPLKVQTKLTNLESPLNFARFYLAELLPAGAAKVLYLDADTIVRGDVAALFDASLPNDELCAATLRKHFRVDADSLSSGEHPPRRSRSSEHAATKTVYRVPHARSSTSSSS